jgi:hypothetical protein
MDSEISRCGAAEAIERERLQRVRPDLPGDDESTYLTVADEDRQPTQMDRLEETKARLAAANGAQRFYGPHSALKDLGWLVGEVERQRDLLTRLEWTGTVVFDEWYDKGKCCPACRGTKDEGHADDCRLAKELSRRQ